MQGGPGSLDVSREWLSLPPPRSRFSLRARHSIDWTSNEAPATTLGVYSSVALLARCGFGFLALWACKTNTTLLARASSSPLNHCICSACGFVPCFDRVLQTRLPRDAAFVGEVTQGKGRCLPFL